MGCDRIFKLWIRSTELLKVVELSDQQLGMAEEEQQQQQQQQQQEQAEEDEEKEKLKEHMVPESSFGSAEPAVPEPGPPEGVSKRQRRPNVRLNEIGDQPLANVLEYFLKRNGGRSTIPGKSPGKLHRQFSGKQNSEDRFIGAKNSKTLKLNHFEKKNGSLAMSRKGKLGHSKHTDLAHPMKPSNGRSRSYDGNNLRLAPQKDMEDDAEHIMQDSKNSVEDQMRTDGLADMRQDIETNQVGSSFGKDSGEGFREMQLLKKRKKKNPKMGSSLKGKHVRQIADEKEEPSSSAVHELQFQLPLWERDISPLDNIVRDWLQRLGLHKYSFLFQRHEVRDDVLPLLTMEDLKEIGITAVGARRKIFTEISKLRQGLVSTDDGSHDEK